VGFVRKLSFSYLSVLKVISKPSSAKKLLTIDTPYTNKYPLITQLEGTVTIECPKCQHENPDETAFCGKCGTKFDSDVEPTRTLETPIEELKRDSVFDYIKVFYNQQRRHSALNLKSPMEYYREASQA
jgi:hypothetical protein